MHAYHSAISSAQHPLPQLPTDSRKSRRDRRDPCLKTVKARVCNSQLGEFIVTKAQVDSLSE